MWVPGPLRHGKGCERFITKPGDIWTSLVAQPVKRLPAITMREAWVRSLGQEDPLEKEMAPHSSPLAWKIPWMEEPGGLQSWGRKESVVTERLPFHTFETLGTRATDCGGHLSLQHKSILLLT